MKYQATTLEKVLALRAFLLELDRRSRFTLSVDMPVHGGVHDGGSRLDWLRTWLMPDIMIHLNKSGSHPQFILLVKEDMAVGATLPELDEWLKEHEHKWFESERREALRVLRRESNRLRDRTDQSSAVKSVNTLEKIFASSSEDDPTP